MGKSSVGPPCNHHDIVATPAFLEGAQHANAVTVSFSALHALIPKILCVATDRKLVVLKGRHISFRVFPRREKVQPTDVFMRTSIKWQRQLQGDSGCHVPWLG